MTQQYILVGTAPNDGQGDPIRTAFIKSNDNFSQLYSRAQTTPPPTLVGSIGDQAGMYAYDSVYFYYCFADYDGSTTIWAQVTQVGNIALTQIQNGTSNVTIIDPDGVASININGTSNVVVINSTGVDVTGYSSTTGTVTGGNIVTVGRVSAGGNITGNYFFGNGSQLTGIPTTYNDSNVTSLLSSFGSNTISTTGNITAGYFFGNGSRLTGVASSYGNTEVAAFLPTYTGNLAGSNLSVTGNINVDGKVNGQLNGLVNGVNPDYGVWDFGYLSSDTYTNPTQWIFAQTSAGNVNMGTITAPTSLNIDIGTIF